MGSHTEQEKTRPLKALAHGISDPFERLHDDMDRMIGNYWRHWNTSRLGFSPTDGNFLVNLDVSETSEDIEVELDVPGFKENDIDVTLSGPTLTIKGKRETQSADKKRDFHRVERSYGEFIRRMPLPAEVDQDAIQARLSDGVLKITLHKAIKAAENEKKIPINEN